LDDCDRHLRLRDAGTRYDDRQCLSAAYPGQHVGGAGPDLVGAHLLHRVFRHHDAANRLARRAIWRAIHLSGLGDRLHDHLGALRVFICVRQSPGMRRDAFDGFGFAMLSLAVGSLQLMLDRGQLNDWFRSTETWIEATLAALCFYLLIVHTMTAGERSFLNREL